LELGIFLGFGIWDLGFSEESGVLGFEFPWSLKFKV
jgi:hypothetical protein